MIRQFHVKFAIICLLCFVVLGLVVGRQVSAGFDGAVIAQTIDNAHFFVRSHGLDERFSKSDLTDRILSEETADLDRQFLPYIETGEVVLVQIWNSQRQLFYSTETGPDERSHKSASLGRALAGAASAEIVSAAEHGHGSSDSSKLIEVYRPIRDKSTGQVVGGLEIYFSDRNLVAHVGGAKRILWGFLSGGLGLLYVLLLAFVGRTSRALVDKERLESVNRDLSVSLGELEETCVGTIKSLAAAVDAKDHCTGGHSVRVSCFANLLARLAGVDEADLERMEEAALFHDLGKIAVPDALLNKSIRSTDEELEQLKGHSAWGEQLIREIPFLFDRAAIIRHHHENFDGTGYPDGLRETEIPIESRIIRIVDAFDTMTSEQPYREGVLSLEQAIEALIEERGTSFDPLLVDLFVEWLKDQDSLTLSRIAIMH